MYFRKDHATLITLLLYITFAVANETCTNCLNVDGKCYTITHILDFTNEFRKDVVITKLGILYKSNTVFYAFEPNISDPEYSKVGYVILNSNGSQGVLAANTFGPNLRTFYIDQANGQIYFGGSNGISFSNNASPPYNFSSLGDTIISIFLKGNLYFVRDGQHKLIEKDNNTFKTYGKYRNMKNFVIDKNNNMIYLNTSGLYANNIYADNTNNATHLSKNPFFRGLTTDKDEETVYAWWIDGIYKLKDAKVVKIANIPNIGAMTFDNNNDILFTADRALYKLIENNATVC